MAEVNSRVGGNVLEVSSPFLGENGGVPVRLMPGGNSPAVTSDVLKAHVVMLVVCNFRRNATRRATVISSI